MYKSFGREVMGVLLRAVVVIIVFVIITGIISFSFTGLTTISDGECNIAVLPIDGVIYPYGGSYEGAPVITPAQVRTFLNSAEEEYGIEGILVEINSPGGTPVSAEVIAERIKDSSLPTVGLIGDVGASGGYLIAAATDTLLASAMSDIGSIGVTMSYIEETKKNEEEGLAFVDLKSGEFKNAGNPNKELTDDERALFEGQLKTVHEEFIRQVANYRDLSYDEVVPLADGSTMLGAEAVTSNLIDRLGGRAEAREIFAREIGKELDEVIFCEPSILSSYI